MNTDLLIQAILDAGYTISSFSKDMNVSRTTLWRKINGLNAFTLDEMQRACELLNISDPRPIFLLGKF